MARFDRPKNTIQNYADLKVGDAIWHVYGIWPPFCAEKPSIVTREACAYRDHPKHDGESSLSDLIVFDEKPDGWEWPHMAFASDGNLVPGSSHNDNYWFRTKDDAEAAQTYLREQWESNPDMIAEEIQRREMDRMFDDAFYDDMESDGWQDYAEDEDLHEENAL